MESRLTCKKCATIDVYQTEFCHLAIPRVLPWCSSHHFNLRVYAHATLITLWSLCKRNQLELVLTRYCLIESLMEFNEENRFVVCIHSR